MVLQESENRLTRINHIPAEQAWSEYDDPRFRGLMSKVLASRVFKDACQLWRDRRDGEVARGYLGENPATPFDNQLLSRFGSATLQTIASLPVAPEEVAILGRFTAIAFLLFSGRGSSQFGDSLNSLLAKPDFRDPTTFVQAVDLLYVATIDTNAGNTLYTFISRLESGEIDSMFDLNVWAGAEGEQFCAERQRLLAASYKSLSDAAGSLQESAARRKDAVLGGRPTNGDDNFARIELLLETAQTVHLLEGLLGKDAERAKSGITKQITGA